MTSPTWYELLGVPPQAGPGEIKAAWRAATDTFEPGSGTGQFRLFNAAADVLLDPEKRAAYDAELAAAQASLPAVSLDKVTDPVAEGGPEADPETAVEAEREADPETAVEAEREADPETDPEAEPEVGAGSHARPAPGWMRVLASTWLAATVAVLTVLVIAAGAVLWYQNRHHADAQDAGQEASAAAQRALPVVLSYDYRHLDADRDQAVKFLTPKYRREYTATFDKLIESSDGTTGPAAQTSAVVTATVRSVGVVDAESDLAKVIVFVDQATVKNGGTPKYSLNRLTVSMVKSGNAWLVNNINSY